MPDVLQSVLLDRDYFDMKSARKYIKDRGYQDYKVDITPHFYRFRQREPNRRKHYVNIAGKHKGVHFVMMY